MSNYIEKKKKRKGGEKNISTAKRGKIGVFFFFIFCIDNIFDAWDFVKKMSLVWNNKTLKKSSISMDPYVFYISHLQWERIIL